MITDLSVYVGSLLASESHVMQVAHQGPATLGIALVAMGEELGTSMAHRALEHLLQYGETSVRQGPASVLGAEPVRQCA
jgi:26S proteasome regulatory subunit N1